jgi:hypothetical protein
MLNRSIVIISCICMLGMTVLPAYAIPCCCKSARMSCGKHSPEQPAGTTKGCCSTVPVKAKSCCEPIPIETCCSGKTIEAPCGACRCLEQLQIVALSGYEAYDSSMRTASSAAVTASPEVVCQPRAMGQPLAGLNVHSLLIGFQTCNLRC